jgi:putative transposase
MAKKYIINLSADESRQLNNHISKGNNGARSIRRAHILLLANEDRKDEEIAKSLRCSASTVQRTRQRYVEEGLSCALFDKPKPGKPEKLRGKAKAHLVALACSEPPEGRAVWTLRMLGDRLVELGLVESISPECVRMHLKKTHASLGSTSNGVLER